MGGKQRKEAIFIKSNTDLSKEARIKKEITRINKALQDLDKNKKAIVTPLIKMAAFTAVSIQDLEEIINEEGFISEYKNGENQYGTKQSDETKTLIALQKNLTAALKTLADLAPPAENKENRLKKLMGE